MGSGSQVFNQVRLSRAEASSLHSDIYQLPVAYFYWTTNLQSTVIVATTINILFSPVPHSCNGQLTWDQSEDLHSNGSLTSPTPISSICSAEHSAATTTAQTCQANWNLQLGENFLYVFFRCYCLLPTALHSYLYNRWRLTDVISRHQIFYFELLFCVLSAMFVCAPSSWTMWEL